ncbi:glycosyltransferase [Salinibacter ruber]|uniref:glycosyltransferase n=1 Tax=Salinibacter ruber TaxID=146919 RepID=UPI000E5724F8|nr:glycosyltransferase [Salinibacter ruber]
MDRVAILKNMIAPYRIPIYRGIGRHFETKVFFSGHESNRTEWNEVERALQPEVAVKKSCGTTISYPDIQGGSVYQHRYLHLTPGYLSDLASFQPDAILTNEMGVRSLLALLYGRIAGAPVWVWWGGTLHTERDIGLPRKIIRGFFRRVAQHWISYGETSTEYLEDIGVDKKNIVQIQNCVDERRFQGDSSPTLSPSVRPALLFVGQLIDRKGVIPLLRSTAELQRQGHEFSLHLVGDGKERASFKSLKNRLDLQHVHFHGTFAPQEMPGIYSSMDALVFPTLEDVWGLVVNEAVWSGLPVLGSIYAGCSRELLPPENIVDPRDHGDLVKGLKRAVEGDLRPPDTDRLWTHEEVVDRLVEEIHSELARN